MYLQLARTHEEVTPSRMRHPIFALHGAPGSGKSYFLDLIAGSRDAEIDSLCNHDAVAKVLGRAGYLKRNRGFSEDQVPHEKHFAHLRNDLKKAVRISITFADDTSPQTNSSRWEMIRPRN